MLLAYYLKTSGTAIKDNKVLLGLLVGGTLFFYSGLFLEYINPWLGSTLKLLGTCLFFTAVAINLASSSKEKAAEQKRFNKDEDSD
jgi:hypothetical protein